MQNSFLIKNHASSNFEKYAATMKKKAYEKSPEKRSDSPNEASEIGRTNISKQNPSPFKKFEYGKVKGKIPASRDGHSMIVVNDQIVVFGGDRHRMPFADTFIFDLRSQFEAL
jgi:hypothetical protein